eukprot:2649728-Pleurochrysis_carterae.AAC.2
MSVLYCMYYIDRCSHTHGDQKGSCLHYSTTAKVLPMIVEVIQHAKGKARAYGYVRFQEDYFENGSVHLLVVGCRTMSTTARINILCCKIVANLWRRLVKR